MILSCIRWHTITLVLLVVYYCRIYYCVTLLLLVYYYYTIYYYQLSEYALLLRRVTSEIRIRQRQTESIFCHYYSTANRCECVFFFCICRQLNNQ